jgi:hypothetical protein
MENENRNFGRRKSYNNNDSYSGYDRDIISENKSISNIIKSK